MNSQTLIDLLEDAGLETRSYSGRGMFGKECVSFNVEHDKLIGEIAAVVEVASINYQDDTVSEFVRMLKRARTDSMGRSEIVVYWPSMEWPKESVA
jgi:hypothetical protein